MVTCILSVRDTPILKRSVAWSMTMLAGWSIKFCDLLSPIEYSPERWKHILFSTLHETSPLALLSFCWVRQRMTYVVHIVDRLHSVQVSIKMTSDTFRKFGAKTGALWSNSQNKLRARTSKRSSLTLRLGVRFDCYNVMLFFCIVLSVWEDDHCIWKRTSRVGTTSW